MTRPWNNNLLFKSFWSYLAIVVVLSAGFFLYSSKLVREFYISSLGKTMEQKSRVIARLLPWQSDPGSLDAACAALGQELDIRITVIAANGTVIGDSEAPALGLENHAQRPEVVEALSQGTGSAVRYSTSVKHNLLYRAYRESRGDRQRIVRVAVSLADIHAVTHHLGRTLFLGVLLCSLLGLAVAYFFSRRLSRRVKRLAEFSRGIAEGKFARGDVPANGGDELDLLEQNLHETGVKIHDSINEIKAEKEKIDSILRCMVEGLLVLDTRGNVVLINEQARKMFHVSVAPMKLRSFADLSRSPAMRDMLREVMSFDFSKPIYSKSICLDQGRWFQVNAVRLRNGDDRPSGSILVFHDVTEIQRLETVRSDFVANVSHELRTPLTAIRGYVETLLQNPPPDSKETGQFLAIIERHSERLSRLTEDLLTLSDLESGSLQMDLKRVAPGQLVQRVVEMFGDQAAKKKIALSQSIASDLPPILGDADRLQQLLINLVDNALKYTPEAGSVRITASLAAPAEPRERMIEIAVTDTGAGIPEKDLPRLTERFYRVDRARSRELGGTGLGLAIVKHVVQAHGGRLSFESLIQKGTTVRVFLPVAAVPECP